MVNVVDKYVSDCKKEYLVNRSIASYIKDITRMEYLLDSGYKVSKLIENYLSICIQAIVLMTYAQVDNI